MGGSASDPGIELAAGANPLIWSLVPNRLRHVAFFNAELAAIHEAILAKAPALTKLKLALVVGGDAASASFANQLEEVLEFNGASVHDNELGGSYARYDYDDQTLGAVSYTELVAALNADPPSVIVLAPEVVVGQLLMAIESGWGSAAKPYYIASHGLEDLEFMTTVYPELRSRIFAVDWTRTANNDALRAVFKVAYKDATRGQTPYESVEPFYDAFYWHALAMHAASSASGKRIEEVTGEEFAAAVGRLGMGRRTTSEPRT